VAGPAIVGAVIEARIGASGFTAATRNVTVEAAPPLILLLGRADEVRVAATGVEARGIRAGAVAVTFDAVRLFDRSFATVSGGLTDVIVTDNAGNDLRIARVDLSGTPASLTVSLHVARSEVTDRIQRAIANDLGTTVSGVTVRPPNVVTAIVAGRTIAGRLAIDSGRLVLQPASGAFRDAVLFDGAGSGLTLTGVSALGDEIVIDGTLDPAAVKP
jgi:hypothetical protein